MEELFAEIVTYGEFDSEDYNPYFLGSSIDIRYKNGSTESGTVGFDTELWDYTTVRVYAKYIE